MAKLEINEFKLYDNVLYVANSMDEELYDLNKTGIFFVPEIHFVFEVGKALYKKRKEIFGTDEIKWIREINLGNGGPSDLVFETESEQVVLEFKIASTSTANLADINKLQKLKKPNLRNHLYFVALIDSFRGKVDPRIEAVFKESDYKPSFNETFNTNYSGYKSKIDCMVAFYSI